MCVCGGGEDRVSMKQRLCPEIGSPNTAVVMREINRSMGRQSKPGVPKVVCDVCACVRVFVCVCVCVCVCARVFVCVCA